MLPHAYPFRFLERASGADGRPVLGWTVGGGLARGAAEVPATLAVEMMAQAALAALPGQPGQPEPAAGAAGSPSAPPPAAGLLAGLEAVCFHRPILAGDRVTAEAELVGRLGRLVKVRVRLVSADVLVGDGPAATGPLAEGELLLALEEPSAGGGRS